MNKAKPPKNFGLADRIVWYVENDMNVKAKALAKLGDHLEECFSWELTFDTDGLE
jgi:hypothetical protein